MLKRRKSDADTALTILPDVHWIGVSDPGVEAYRMRLDAFREFMIPEIHAMRVVSSGEGLAVFARRELGELLFRSLIGQSISFTTTSDTIQFFVVDEITNRSFRGTSEDFLDLGNFSGSHTLDVTRNNQGGIQTGNVTLTIPAPPDATKARFVTLTLKQDAAGGRTMSFSGSNILELAHPRSVAANRINQYTFHWLPHLSAWLVSTATSDPSLWEA